MPFVVCQKEGSEPSEKATIERLLRFIEESDVSFYQIASLIGTSSGMLSMWLARTTKPDSTQLATIERFLNG